MSAASILWGTAGTAAVLPVIRLITLRMHWVPSRLINTVLSKTFYAGQWDRAQKLCRAADKSPYCAAVNDVLQAIEELPQASGARTIITPLRMVFEESFATHAPRFFTTRWLSYLAGLLLIVPPLHWRGALIEMANLQSYLALVGFAALLIAIVEYFATQMRDTCAVSGMSLMDQLSNAMTRASEAPIAPPPPMPTRPISASAEASAARLVLHIHREDTFLEERGFTEETIKIGKLPSAHVGANEESLSRMHAVLEVDANDNAQVIDLGSTQGTFVDGQKVTKAALREGSEVRIGALRLIVKRIGKTRASA